MFSVARCWYLTLRLMFIECSRMPLMRLIMYVRFSRDVSLMCLIVILMIYFLPVWLLWVFVIVHFVLRRLKWFPSVSNIILVLSFSMGNTPVWPSVGDIVVYLFYTYFPVFREVGNCFHELVYLVLWQIFRGVVFIFHPQFCSLFCVLLFFLEVLWLFCISEYLVSCLIWDLDLVSWIIVNSAFFRYCCTAWGCFLHFSISLVRFFQGCWYLPIGFCVFRSSLSRRCVCWGFLASRWFEGEWGCILN